MEEDTLVVQRKEKLAALLRIKRHWIAYLGLAIIAYVAFWIRTLNLAGLRDIATGGWTLGPDLDPFLFLRWAKHIITQGALMPIDTLRYVPLGFDTRGELILFPYMIAWFHKIAVFFGSTSIEQSAALFPAYAFALTIIAFFLLTRKIFVDNLGMTKANSIALVASFFLAVIPALLPRTIAGIPEKESAGFLLIFLALYFFLCGWKSSRLTPLLIYGLLSGISTGIMMQVWGGVAYVYFVISITFLVTFIFGQVTNNRIYLVVLWLSSASLSFLPFSIRNTPVQFFTTIPLLIIEGVLLAALIYKVLDHPRLQSFMERNWVKKIPRSVLALLIVGILAVIAGTIIFGPEFLKNKFNEVADNLVTPITDRLGVTVAENRQPFFAEWANSFGPMISGIPIFFGLFVIGSIYLFYNMMNEFTKKERWLISLGYILFLISIIFSRYAPASIFNGTNDISVAMYAAGFFILVATLGWSGVRSTSFAKHYKTIGVLLAIFIVFYALNLPLLHNSTINTIFLSLYGLLFFVFCIIALCGVTREERFKHIDAGLIMIFVFFFLSIVSARGAVRLIMVLVPPSAIIVAYFVVMSIIEIRKVTDDLMKIVAWIAVAAIVIAAVYAGYQFYSMSKGMASGYVPSSYTHQWQRAMYWVDQNTSQNAVFAHWWDYGYWVQSIGNRATVLDGGNAIPYWDYLMGRYLLTTRDTQESLAFLYTHNTTHILIDSTDIGKYGAFSSIGSDERYDRRSWFSFFGKQRTEDTKNTTITFYQGGFPLDQDIIYSSPNGTITLPEGKAAIGAIIIETNRSGSIISQPQGIYIYQKNTNLPQTQYVLPLRYAYYNNELNDFGSGVEAGIFTLPTLNPQTGAIDRSGVLMYLSNKTVQSQLARFYLYEEKNPYFTLVHSEDDVVVMQLKGRGLLNSDEDFVFFEGFRGPLRIWEIDYPNGIQSNPEYLRTVYPDERLRRA